MKCQNPWSYSKHCKSLPLRCLRFRVVGSLQGSGGSIPSLSSFFLFFFSVLSALFRVIFLSRDTGLIWPQYTHQIDTLHIILFPFLFFCFCFINMKKGSDFPCWPACGEDRYGTRIFIFIINCHFCPRSRPPLRCRCA